MVWMLGAAAFHKWQGNFCLERHWCFYLQVGAGRQEQVPLTLASSVKPCTTSEWKALRALLRSMNRCQLSKGNDSALSLPGCVLANIQSDYKPIAPACPRSRKPPSAGWWDLVSVTDSAASRLLQSVSSCPCFPKLWEWWNSRKKWQKNLKKGGGRMESCATAGSFSPGTDFLAKHLLNL